MNSIRSAAEQDEKPEKKTALERFGRNLTALAAEGALPPLIGRRAELVAITRVLLTAYVKMRVGREEIAAVEWWNRSARSS